MLDDTLTVELQGMLRMPPLAPASVPCTRELGEGRLGRQLGGAIGTFQTSKVRHCHAVRLLQASHGRHSHLVLLAIEGK